MKKIETLVDEVMNHLRQWWMWVMEKVLGTLEMDLEEEKGIEVCD